MICCLFLSHVLLFVYIRLHRLFIFLKVIYFKIIEFIILERIYIMFIGIVLGEKL